MKKTTLELSQAPSKSKNIRRKAGFTLIEIIAVLVLLGILAAVAVPRYINMADDARVRAVQAGIAELNGRESLVWSQQMIANAGSVTDADIVTATDAANIGASYSWTDGPEATGGTLVFDGGNPVVLTRTAANNDGPAVWTEATTPDP
ncbi:MAG: prepilin-type N-terminal cleavage/methylation domain-containing protein [Opitutales bacterium]|nr:prepilin-type N-terminal cleavage/methylation domain-containing protein [Opitutales bacterium]